MSPTRFVLSICVCTEGPARLFRRLEAEDREVESVRAQFRAPLLEGFENTLCLVQKRT